MIPNNHFYIYLSLKNEFELSLMQYISILSNIVFNNPYNIYLYTNSTPTGELWDKIKDQVQTVFISDKDLTNVCFKSNVKRYQADILRFQLLLQHGGIYTDLDTMFLQPIPEKYFKCNSVAGNIPSNQNALENTFLMSVPDSEFIQEWLDKANSCNYRKFKNKSDLLYHNFSFDDPRITPVDNKQVFARIFGKQSVKEFLRYGENLYSETFLVHFLNSMNDADSIFEKCYYMNESNWLTDFINKIGV